MEGGGKGQKKSLRLADLQIYLIGREALSILNNDLEFAGCLFDLNIGRTTQIAVSEIAVAKCQRVDRVMVFVVDGPVVHKTSNAPSLQFRCQHPR